MPLTNYQLSGCEHYFSRNNTSSNLTNFPSINNANDNFGENNPGSKINKRYGNLGSFFGDMGFNSLSQENLWPFPNESRIKKDICETVSRDFCSSNKSLTEYLNAF